MELGALIARPGMTVLVPVRMRMPGLLHAYIHIYMYVNTYSYIYIYIYVY